MFFNHYKDVFFNNYKEVFLKQRSFYEFFSFIIMFYSFDKFLKSFQ